jgi:hypothetical protein
MDSSEKARADGTAWSAGLAGIAAFIVFSIITQTLMNNAPSATESSQKIFSYLALHQGQLQASAVLAALAAFAVLVWASALFRAARSIEGRTTGLAVAAFGGGVLTAASTVTLALIGGTTATRLHDLGPAGARVLWTMIELSRGAILVGLLVVIGATALICLRIQPLRWFAVLSAMVALVSGIGACTIGYTTPWIQAVAGWAIFIDGLWIFLVGCTMSYWNRPDTASGPRIPDQASQPGSGPRDPETSNALLGQPGSRPGSVMTARGALPSRGVSARPKLP